MLKPVQGIRVIRFVQVGLVVAALFLGLTSAESQVQRSVDIGGETLAVSFEAPVQMPRGPWAFGQTFTLADAGVPVDVAPEWTLTALHGVTGVQSTGHGWSADLELAERGADTKLFWKETRSLEVQSDGGRAWVTLDVEDVVDRATVLEQEASMPGRLEVVVLFHHESFLVVNGKEQSTLRTASLAILPDLQHVLAVPTDGSSTFTAPPAPQGSFVSNYTKPLGLLAFAGVLEVGPLVLRRRVKLWEAERGLDFVDVHGLAVPSGTPKAPFHQVASVARKGEGVLLIDAEQGLALLPGAHQLLAELPGFKPPKATRRARAARGRRRRRGFDLVDEDVEERPQGPAPPYVLEFAVAKCDVPTIQLAKTGEGAPDSALPEAPAPPAADDSTEGIRMLTEALEALRQALAPLPPAPPLVEEQKPST